MSFAIIQTGGKQYKVKASEILKIEKLEKENSSKIEFKEVLAYGNDKTIEVGLGALFPDVPDTALEQGLRATPIKGLATASKVARVAYDKILKDVFVDRIPNPFKVPEFAGGIGTGFGPKAGDVKGVKPEFGPDPRIRWDTTEGKEQARLFRDQFTDATLIEDGASTKNPLVYKPEVKVSPRGVPISKRKEGGYKFLGDFAKEWNTWSTDGQFIDELADAPGKAFVEHLVGKGDRLNWFWNLPNEVRFRKGSRHGPNNVRLFYSDRQKKLKDATENILYNMQEGMNPRKRLIVEYDIPKMEGKSITVRQPAGDVILRKVDGTEVGRLGDYFDVLYARTPILEEALTTNINPRTGTFYIDPNTPDIKRAIQKWREKIITDKLNKIIDEAPNIKGKTASEIYQEKAGEIIDKDLADFNAEYSFIPKPKGSTLDATIAATSFEGPPPDIKKLLGINPTPEMTTFLKENNQGLDMLIDRIRGSSWNQLKKNYKGYNQKKVEKVLSQLTSNDIEKIQRAYGIKGKGALNEKGKFKIIRDIIDLRIDNPLK